MMKKHARAAMLLLCLLLPLSGLCESAEPDHGASLDAIFKRFKTMGGAVCVFQNGEITYTHVYGRADKSTGELVTPDTLFQVGSITKLISTVGLMRLCEQGAFSLDDDVGTLLDVSIRNPQYPNTPITVRQVLTHTAGLRDSGHYDQALGGGDMTLDKLFSGDRAQYQFLNKTRPGTSMTYCNFGGGLIGSLIEKLSYKTVDDYMAENVFAPLGITAAYQARLIPETLTIAKQYDTIGGYLTQDLRKYLLPLHDQPDPERAFIYTAGKLIISAPDLSRLMILLCDGGIYQDARILKASTVAEMVRRQQSVGSVTADSGRGLSMNIAIGAEVDGRTLYGHGGKANGMLCAAYFDKSDRTGVVMLTNGCDNDQMYQGVGALGRIVLTYCYQNIIGDDPVVIDPFLVTD